MNIKQKETILVANTSTSRLMEIIGPERELRHYEGNTSGDCLYGVTKNSLARGFPQVRNTSCWVISSGSRMPAGSPRLTVGMTPLAWSRARGMLRTRC